MEFHFRFDRMMMNIVVLWDYCEACYVVPVIHWFVFIGISVTICLQYTKFCSYPQFIVQYSQLSECKLKRVSIILNVPLFNTIRIASTSILTFNPSIAFSNHECLTNGYPRLATKLKLCPIHNVHPSSWIMSYT